MGHRLEYAILSALLCVLAWLPLPVASAVAGRIGRFLGHLVPQRRIARNNLHLALPHLNTEKVEKIINGMSENMGRYFGELAHIGGLSKDEVLSMTEIVGAEHYHAAVHDPRGALFFSAHMGNWEWGAKAAWALGAPFSVVYRPLNNPYVERITNRIRDNYQRKGIPKSSAGSREFIGSLKRGEAVAILIDQRMRGGTPIQFFGRDAATATSLGDLALKYGSPVVPTRVERLDKCVEPRFRVTFEAPLETTGKDAVAIMRDAHATLERWISERPEQWFWVHRRWG